MNDMYDIVRETLRVNSPISTMNSDFVMSDLSPALIQNTVMTYIREQLNIIEIINIYLDNKELQDDEYKEKVNRILLNEVFSMVILSRANRARVIEALVKYIMGSAGAQQVTTQDAEAKKPGFLESLNPFTKKRQNKMTFDQTKLS